MRRIGFLAAPILLALGCRGEGSLVTRQTSLVVREVQPPAGALALPLRDGSVRFAVIGDSGRGDAAQLAVASQMAAWHRRFPFTFVLMLGDNIYPPHAPDDYQKKFEEPYRALLDARVEFRAAIGNHDEPDEVYYKGFNMSGRRYYTFREGEEGLKGLTGAGARFFALDSRSFDRAQLGWLQHELAASTSRWKIAYFHHPLYTSGRYQVGARLLRAEVEPLFVNGDVDVVLSGHEHFYERIVPQRGIAYFISGGAGSLRRDDIRRPSAIMARGFDTDYHFLMMEVAGDELWFQAISRTGATIDAGVITRRAP